MNIASNLVKCTTIMKIYSNSGHSFLLVIAIFSLLASCGLNDVKPTKYEEVFKPYVEKFIAEAQKRNKAIDFYGSGVSVVFSSNLRSGAAGYADIFEKKIVIDSVMWKSWSDDSKEQVMFHEFGHYFLNRDHDINVMPNGEARTIMEGNPWETHLMYRGMRKAYYIDEFFDMSTPYPYWADTTFRPAIPSGRKLLGNFVFNDAKKWASLMNNSVSIINGALVIEQQADTGIPLNSDELLAELPDATNIKSSKSYEIEINYGFENGVVGMSWLSTDGQNYDNTYVTTFSNEGKYNFNLLNDYGDLGYKVNNLATNKLLLKRYNGFQSIWLNGKMLFFADILNPETAANSLRLLLYPMKKGTILRVNSIKISQII